MEEIPQICYTEAIRYLTAQNSKREEQMAIGTTDMIRKQIEELVASLDADDVEYAICIKGRDGSFSAKHAGLYANLSMGTEMAFIELLASDIIGRKENKVDAAQLLKGLEVRLKHHDDLEPKKVVLQ